MSTSPSTGASTTSVEGLRGFVAGTLVHTQCGLRPINTVRVGDWVLSKPGNGTGEACYKRVTGTFETPNCEVWYVRVARVERAEHSTQEVELGASGRHPFFVTATAYDEYVESDEDRFIASGAPGRWVNCNNVEVGMLVTLLDGAAAYIDAHRIYRTNQDDLSWVPLTDEGKGPHLRLTTRGTEAVHKFDEYVFNDDHYGLEPEHEKTSWKRATIFSISVEDHHVYLASPLGILVPGTAA